MKTYIYELNKRNIGLYKEIEKLVRFYFKEVEAVALKNYELIIKYNLNTSKEENIEDKFDKLISNYVRGFKTINVEVLVESKIQKDNCVKPSMQEYIEVAHGVRLKFGLFERVESKAKNKIENMFSYFSPCKVQLPSMIDNENLIKLGYYSKFPNLLNFVSNFKKQPDLIDTISRGDALKCCGEMIDNNIEFNGKVLNPVTCYHLYPIANKLIKQSNNYNYYITGSAYRYESYNMDVSRLNEFTLVEMVSFGVKKDILEIRKKAIESFTKLFENWELDFRIESSADVFYGAEAGVMMATQRMEKSKYEIQMNSYNGYQSIGSFNFHNKYFCEKCDIKRDDEILTSGCIGFGIERLLYSIFSQHGEDVSKWPSFLRADLVE